MTIEETKKAIEVMQAYVDGKEIEVKSFGSAPFKEIPNPVWDWYRNEYRVKPESKVRPYANADECFNDMLKHGGWYLDQEKAYCKMCRISNYGFAGLNFEEIVKYYVWADDGSPCGIVES